MKYRSEIDGLRALAVIPVILFHAGFSLFSGGYVGVDVFFVISGYLITTILVSDLKAGNFSILGFYERRARRILPALFFVVLASMPVAWVLLSPNELVSFSKSITAVSLFYSNIFFSSDDGYFSTAAELKPLLHTWSLAVEEQYYVLFPIFLLFIWRCGKRYVLGAVILLSIISLGIAQIGAISKPVPNFFLLQSRAWEIAFGAIAALCILGNRSLVDSIKLKQIYALFGFVFIIASILLYNKGTPFPSLYGLLPTVGAVLIILFADQDTYIGKLLGSNAFSGVGLISYSAYLWHQPILAFARSGIQIFGEIPNAVLIPLIFLLSVFSWKYIESPFRSANVFGRKFIFSCAVLASIFFAILGFLTSKEISHISNESYMAKKLSTSAAIYVSNMNERTFIRSRIEVENISPKTIVLGSSRIMQISSKMLGVDLLNLGVSGSSIEDDVAIWRLASDKFHPEVVLIGADPWLFNAKSGQDRWRVLESVYYSALNDIGMQQQIVPTTQNFNVNNNNNNDLINLYHYLNTTKISAHDDAPELKDKIRRDGSRVYNLPYANKTNSEVEGDAISYASYSMSPYEYSVNAEKTFKNLIKSIQKEHQVVLVLSPYHPKLYSHMSTHEKKFLEVEKKFRELGAAFHIPVIGSYDPASVGCNGDEFYDAMHPKDSCMDKVLMHLK